MNQAKRLKMSWLGIFLLVNIILLYVGISVTVIIIVAQYSNLSDNGIIFAIVILSMISSVAISSMIYFLILNCIHRYHHQTAPEPPPPPNIPIVTKTGSLIQQPNGDIELGIKMLPVGIEPTTSGS